MSRVVDYSAMEFGVAYPMAEVGATLPTYCSLCGYGTADRADMVVVKFPCASADCEVRFYCPAHAPGAKPDAKPARAPRQRSADIIEVDLTGYVPRFRSEDAPTEFDILPSEVMCPDCFTVKAASGHCLCT